MRRNPFALPGFRRCIEILPAGGSVMAALEDDFHAMAVRLIHRAGRIVRVEPMMHRAPWTTCPGARSVLREAFEGLALDDAIRVAGKTRHCTHLYDLASLAAAHASDPSASRFDMAVSDPAAGEVHALCRLNGHDIFRFSHRDNVLVHPDDLAGVSLFDRREWRGRVGPARQEAARLLQWCAILAHGRQIPMHRQNDALRMPANCYTFQPANALKALRVGEVVDFSASAPNPLQHFTGGVF